MEILSATPNPYKGIVINSAELCKDVSAFQIQLTHSLDFWRKENYQVVWLEISLEQAELIPVATAAGFVFHHSQENYLLLTYRLVEGAFIPAFSTHYTGAGGVVLNEKNELLVVSERYRNRQRPSYKLPGGALNQGEHIAECVVREVQEETGVRTQLESLVLSHIHI